MTAATREIDAITDAALAAPVVRLALLVDLDFASGRSRIWSGLGALSWGGNTWQGMGDLLAVSSIEETAEVRSVAVTLTLAGVPGSAVALLADDERWQNREARIHLATFDADGVTMQGEPVQIMRGRMDQLGYSEGETATFTLTVESRLADLERPRIRRYTSADQQLIYPDDRGLEYVEDVANGVQVEW